MHNGMGMPMGMGIPMPGFPMMPGAHIALAPHPSPVMTSSPAPSQAHGRPVQQQPSMNQQHTYSQIRPATQSQPARQNPPAQQARSSIAQPAPASQVRQSSPQQPPTAVQPRQAAQAQPAPAQVRQSTPVVQSTRPNAAQQPRPAPAQAARSTVQQKQQQPSAQQRPTVSGQPPKQNQLQQQRQGAPSQTPRPASQGFVTELWVVRHGETPENKTRTIAGQNASGLTPMGAKQAALLANRLRGVRFHSIFLSDLNRTKQTADPVLKALPPGIPAFTDSRLREKGAGQYEGFKIGYIEQMTRYTGLPHRLFRPPGGESWEDVAARSRSFMKDVLERHCVVTADQQKELKRIAQEHREKQGSNSVNGTEDDEVKKVLIITHGGFISEFLSMAVGGIGNSSKNCSLSILGIKMTHPRGPPQFWMKLINDIEHLSTIGAPVPPPNTQSQPIRTTPQPQAKPSVTGSAEPMRAEGYEADPPNDPGGYEADPPNEPEWTADDGEETRGGPVDTDEEEAVERPLGHETATAAATDTQEKAAAAGDATEADAVVVEKGVEKVHLNGTGGGEGKEGGEASKLKLRDAVQC